MPEDKPLSENWSAEARFAVVLETAGLSELELGEYCRRKGLAPNTSTPGAKPVSLACRPFRSSRRSTANKRARTRSASRTLSVSYATKTRLVLRKKLNDYWGPRQRGQLTSLPERQLLMAWLTEAIAAGTRKVRACQAVGLSLRTLQRWTEADVIEADARTTNVRPVLRNALSEVERQAIVALYNIPARHPHENPARRTGTNPWLRCQ